MGGSVFFFFLGGFQAKPRGYVGLHVLGGVQAKGISLENHPEALGFKSRHSFGHPSPPERRLHCLHHLRWEENGSRCGAFCLPPSPMSLLRWGWFKRPKGNQKETKRNPAFETCCFQFLPWQDSMSRTLPTQSSMAIVGVGVALPEIPHLMQTCIDVERFGFASFSCFSLTQGWHGGRAAT